MSDDALTASSGGAVTPPPLDAVLHWRPWSDARTEAAATRRPLFVFAEAAWTTSAQRLAWCLEQDDELRTRCEERWVPCHVDPWSEPDVVAWLRFEATTITGEPGPPLLVLLDDEGEPFMAFGTLAYEGADGIPSLGSLLSAAEDLHLTERVRLREEAEARRSERRAADPTRHAPGNVGALADAVVEGSDPVYGGLHGVTKEVLPHALLALIEVVERGTSGPARRHLERTLDYMQRGGIRDQLWRGFHRASRDERWVVPHFEQHVPVNAALAAVFARAGRCLERPDFTDVAESTLEWVTLALEAGVDAVEADTAYHTWTPAEIRRVVTPDVLQVLGFHYHLTPNAARQVLYQAVAPEDLHEYAHEPQETLLSRLALGREQLRLARQARRTPTTLGAPIVSWRADATVMALACAEALGHDQARLLAVVESIADAAVEPGGASGQQQANVRLWFEDQVALAHLLADAGLRADRSDWLDRARRATDAVVRHWPRVDAAFALREPAVEGSPSSRVAVLDAAIASPVSHLLAAVRLTMPHPGDTLRDLVEAHAASATVDVARAAAFWRVALATP